jgi:Sulfatase-modifying factor enzyme 1
MNPTICRVSIAASIVLAVTGSTFFCDGCQNYLTDVGAYTLSTSPYGTFDQGGNVWEWNETHVSGLSRGLRGGSFFGDSGALLASFRHSLDPTATGSPMGFRVASIPEPGATVLLIFAALESVVIRKRFWV